jgi:hypothetical protein
MEHPMTLSRSIHVLILVLATGLSPTALVADTSPAFAMADGQPWQATGPNGRPMQITFHEDGRAEMKMGFMRMKLSWIPTDDGFCLEGGPQGTKCVTLIQTDTGYQGIEGGQVTMVLGR